MVKNPSNIKNKCKRTEVYKKYKKQKGDLKKAIKAEKKKENEALGDKAPPKQVRLDTHLNVINPQSFPCRAT